MSAKDAANLVSALRLTKKSIGIVALVETEEGYPPTELIRAGVDRLIVKSPGTVSLLVITSYSIHYTKLYEHGSQHL